ncbi:MAG: hypothetical protein QOH69_2427 [Actinomycetota bacterium]|nr:hypothetical protein [Actinomycetota bacterium]
MSDTFDGHQRERLPAIALEDLFAGAAYQPPRLEDDPAARILGLVVDPALRFDGSAVKRARIRAGLKLPLLVQKLIQRGWEVTNSEALGWENGRSGAIAPALIAAVADIVGASQSSLAASAPTNDPVSAIRTSESFRQLVTRAAEALSVPWDVAAAKLESAAAIPVHRGGTPDIDAALQSLEVLVEELESRRR